MKKVLKNFMDEHGDIGKEFLPSIYKGYEKYYKKKLSDDERIAIDFTAGYMSSRLSGTIFIRDIVPLIRKSKIIFWMLIISIGLLISALSIIWTTVNIDSFEVFVILFLPALIGVSLSVLKGFKLWSEAKKNLAEAKKVEQEFQ